MPPKLTQNPPDPDLITTITEFQISPDINILELNLDDGSLLSAKWAKVMNPLRNTPGWKYAQWGRLIERPDTVLLVSDWTSRQLLEDFKNSLDYEVYLNGLSELGPPRCYEVYFPNGVVRNSKYRPSITKIYFPAPVSDEKKEEIGNIRGVYTPTILRPCRFGHREGEPARTEEEMQQARIARASRFQGYYSRYSKGWQLEHEVREGVEMEVFIWVYNWFNAEMEEKGKNGVDGQSARYPHERRGLSNHKLWTALMIDCGAVSFVEEHWENCHIWMTWEKSQREAKEYAAQMVNARPLTFDEVFGSPKYESSST